MTAGSEIARIAGVSQSTVSRVLNGTANVKPETRARVLRALEEHTPNAIARAMRRGRTESIGVVVGGITNPYVPELLEALSTSATQRGLTLTLWNEHEESLPAAVAGVRGGVVDGLVLTSATTAHVPALQRLLDRGTPMVLMNRGVSFLDADQVTSDNAQIGRLAAQYLLRHGRRNIGLVIGPEDTQPVAERREAFLEELWSAGQIDVHRGAVVRGELAFSTGEQAAIKLLELKVDTVFCGNDIQAFGLISGLQALRTRVPDDVWVVGVDDLEMSAWSPFSLTTIRQQVASMADAAVDLLEARIADPTTPKQVRRLPGELVVRASTASADGSGLES